MMIPLPKIQVKIGKRNGRNRAAYRTWLYTADRWSDTWHHMTVADARRAMRAGRHDVGGTLGICQVETP